VGTVVVRKRSVEQKKEEKSHKQHTPLPTAKCIQIFSHWSVRASRAGLLPIPSISIPYPFTLLPHKISFQQLQ